MFRMSKHLIYIVVSLFIVVIAAAQTAIADSVTVELAERTPPADPGDPILSAPPPTYNNDYDDTSYDPEMSR